MIDTIVLTLNTNMFTILDHDKFSPSTKGLYDFFHGYYRLGGRSNIACVQNPTSNDLRQGIYKPRLTVTKRINQDRNFEITLKIEFSIPKLLYGNNFDELTDSDFLLVIQKLKTILKEMGVDVLEQYLINAPVSSVHYSKNIVLTDYTTPYTYLSELSKLNINQKLDTNRTDFRNDGHSLKYRANSFEIVFYDKIKDLQQAKISEKRAEERDNILQLGLFDARFNRKPFEVLRIEIRLNQRKKIRQVFRKIGKDIEPIFKNIFKQDIAKDVLLYYINELEKAYPSLLADQYGSPKEFLAHILLTNPKIKLNLALKMLGLRALLDEIGVREFRQITKRYGSSSWYRLNKEMKILYQNDKPSIFSLLREQISTYTPIKLFTNANIMFDDATYG